MRAGDLNLRSKLSSPSVLLPHHQPPFPIPNVSPCPSGH